MSAHYETRGPVAVITLDNPPVNGLGLETRRAVAAGLQRAQHEAAVQAIVIAGAGQAFSAGADIREFGSSLAAAEPSLSSLIGLVEASAKPVLAAMHSVAMGGGLELALGCHYRVATRDTRVALPEVRLGLLPGAGGTQRLPRALGVEKALDMIVGGEPVQASALAALPGQKLFDRLVDGEVLGAALSLAAEVAGRRPLPLLRRLSAGHPGADACLQSARDRLQATARHLPAPLQCVEAVAASVGHSFDEGLRTEREAFALLMASDESRALRHRFLAERAAAKLPDVPAGTPVRPLAEVAVIGAGTMGSGIAMTFLNAGLPVTLLETTQQALDKGLAVIRGNYEAQLAKGRLGPDQLARRMGLLRATLRYEDLKDADLAIEAVFEDMAVKEQVFRALDEVVKPGAILASNTSTLDLDRIAAFTRRPQDVVGLHFFSPAQVMRLLEVVRGARTAADVLATAMALGRTIGKTCVVSRVCDGFIGNRMLEQYSRQAGLLLDEGASPQQIDRAAESFGLAMGPFRMGDLAGNDIGWAIRQRRRRERPGPHHGRAADLLCELGRFGQKTGAGWYDYEPGRREALPSAVVAALLERHRAALGIVPRAIGDEEIVQRLVYALVNEGARILEEGIAARASDIDVVYLAGYGFPAHRGGPMHYADTQGLSEVVAALRRFGRNPLDDAGFWTPAPLLARLAAEGGTFSADPGTGP